MNQPHAASFREIIEEPWQRILGTPLIAVAYEVLSCDLADFDVNAPNSAGGCQAIRVTFGGGAVALEWDWREPAYRVGSTAFHLAVRAHPAHQADHTKAATQDAAGVVRVTATEAAPRRNLAREVLKQVTVWGWTLASGHESPQAATFSFTSGDVTVAIGYSAQTMPGGRIGDGDELLVLDQSQWSERLQSQAEGTRLKLLRRLPEA